MTAQLAPRGGRVYGHRVRKVVAIIVGLLVLCGDASAVTLVSPDGHPLSHAYIKSMAAAERTFPAMRGYCPTVAITFSDEEPEGADSHGWGAWADELECRVNFRPDARRLRFREVCPTAVHEGGHLARLQFPGSPDPYHSTDPHHIMYAWGGRWPSECGLSEAQLQPYIARGAAFDHWLEHRRPRLLRHAEAACPNAACRRRITRRVNARSHRMRRSWRSAARVLRANHARHYIDLRGPGFEVQTD